MEYNNVAAGLDEVEVNPNFKLTAQIHQVLEKIDIVTRYIQREQVEKDGANPQPTGISQMEDELRKCLYHAESILRKLS